MSFKIPQYVGIWLLAVCSLFSVSVARADNGEMQRYYQALQTALAKNVYNIPLFIQSMDQDNTMLGVVYGVTKQPFQDVKRALTSAQAWCDIVPQHLNVKACTFARQENQCQITFYSGRKFYEKAEDVYKLRYRFEVTRTDATYFQTTLTAGEGPMGTSNYRIEVEAIPISAQQTFLHFSYAYRYNFLTTLGMQTYLSTLGSGKIGFNVTATDAQDHPVYVDGIRGIIERNSVRYYFAIQSYLDTLQVAPEMRFMARNSNWFELTEKYPQQLHELDKNEYLEYKQHEHANQLKLQQQVQQTCNPPISQVGLSSIGE